jgi:ABC-type nitrate/sulfonate/bicarbonate transport system permease component
MTMQQSSKFYNLLSIFAIVVIWHFASGTIFNEKLVPPPWEVLGTMIDMAKSGELWEHVAISMKRILIGYFWGNVIGIPVGLLMGRIFWFRGIMDPIIGFMRSIAPVALIPLAIVWFGIGETSKYFIILYAAVVVVILNTMAGVMSTPVIRVRAAQCLGASQFKIFTSIMLPSAWPYILTGMRVALGFSFMGVVAAEMIAAEAGIGYLIMQARLMILVNQMFVGLLVLGVLGIITDRTFEYIISKTMRRYMLEVGR